MLAQVITTLWLVGASGAFQLHPMQVETRWNSGDVPSCELFEFRTKTFLKQREEARRLLEELKAQPQPWSDAQLLELTELQSRELELSRELKGQKLMVVAKFSLSELAPAELEWLEQRRFRIFARTPGLTWGSDQGYDVHDLEVKIDGGLLRVEASYHLGDYCSSNNEIYVELTQL